MWSGVRRAARSGSRSGVAVQLRGKSSASLPSSSAVQRLRGVNSATLQTRGLFTRKTEAVPIVQAIALDKFGKKHHVQVKPTVRASSDTEEMLLMAKWAATLLATGACMAGAMGESGQAHAASSGGSKNSDTEDLLEQIKKKVQTFVDEYKDALQNVLPAEMAEVQKQIDEFLASGKGGQVSWGFMMGACSGFALKKVSKVGALALGSVFILFQCASYAGYINVNHKKLEKDVMDVLDINKDGVFDSKDVDDVYKRVMKVLEYSMPAGSGFAVGFLVGFRAG